MGGFPYYQELRHAMELELRPKLNLGCGKDTRPGWVNVDIRPGPGVDKVWDLSRTPWPWLDASFDVVLASHILEHVEDPYRFIQECSRVLKPGGRLLVYVPYWKNAAHCWGHLDHKRVVHPEALRAFVPEGAGSRDLLIDGNAGLFSSFAWGFPKPPRTNRWGQSRFLPGLWRLGASRLGILTHLWYRLRLTRFLQMGEIEMVLTK